jgi:hypothetical protein
MSTIVGCAIREYRTGNVTALKANVFLSEVFLAGGAEFSLDLL